MSARRPKPPNVPVTVTVNEVELTTAVEATRIHPLTPHRIPAPEAISFAEARTSAPASALMQPFVMYWMLNSVREKQSPALEYAAAIAKHLRVPLRAVHTFDLLAQDNTPLTERHAYFLLEALRDVQTTLREKRNISLAVVAPGSQPEDAILALAKHAVAIVTDTSYLRKGIQDRLRVAAALKKALRKTPFIAVEGDIVVPVEQVTDKAEHAARTIRPKITRLIPEYVTQLEPVELSKDLQPILDSSSLSPDGTRAWVSSAGLETLDVRDVEAAVNSLSSIDRGAPRVPSGTFYGGESAAQEVLSTFLKRRLERYASGRNEPALSLQSDLSPYLRIGSISVVDIVLQSQAFAKDNHTKGVKEGLESFLEELIVRRELSVNMCWFGRDDYDVYDRAVPTYAKESLALHKADKRPVIYSYEELEAALTYDNYWNTAQLELIVTGKVRARATSCIPLCFCAVASDCCIF
jgi:deoxyribodipyrimidine photo-lyase